MDVLPGVAPDERSSALRALARVGARHGLQLSPSQLRRTSPFDGPEPKVGLLMRIAERSGFAVKRLKVRPGELRRLATVLPALLLLSNGRAVVIQRLQESPNGAPALLVEEFPEGDAPREQLLDEPRLFAQWDGTALLIKRRWRGVRWAGFEIGAVAPAEAIEHSAPLLEKVDHLTQRRETLDAIARVITPTRSRPAGPQPFAAPRFCTMRPST